jgi:hypothetical protein
MHFGLGSTAKRSGGSHNGAPKAAQHRVRADRRLAFARRGCSTRALDINVEIRSKVSELERVVNEVQGTEPN